MSAVQRDLVAELRRQIGFILIGLRQSSTDREEVLDAVAELSQLAKDIEEGEVYDPATATTSAEERKAAQ
jgi:hypothetical protein